VEQAIVLKDLSICYGKKQVLHGVTASVPRGGVTSMVGPSGCGKSSLLSVLNRISDVTPDCNVSGSAEVLGREVLAKDCDLGWLRSRVGFVFQKPTPFPLSVRKNLSLPLEEHGLTRGTSTDDRVEELLSRVGLWKEVKDRLGRSALELSGGQQQRLCIARALTVRPEILLADEPCSALDPMSTGVVEELLRDLSREMTVMLVTHNLAQARRLSDHVMVLWADRDGGYVVEAGAAGELFARPQSAITRAYFGGQCC
jgi:phosphate transport system ATP-binding protein